jgi:hypothetical protein
MSNRREYDPLSAIPKPDVIREKLDEVERKAARLRVLLRVSEELHSQTNSTEETPSVQNGQQRQ